MKATIKTFQSGSGDCIFLVLADDDNKYVVMVDCGKYTKPIKEYVENTLQNHIDLLIVTHIDCDHVNGVVRMLRQNQGLYIGRILYNCYQQVNVEQQRPMPELVKADIEKLTQRLPAVVVENNQKIGIEQASTLAQLILEHEQWSQVWHHDSYITNETEPIDLGQGWGCLTFLSPRQEDLNVLDEQFRKEYKRLTHHTASGQPFTGQETLYELVLRIVEMKRKSYSLVKSKKVSNPTYKLTERALNEAYQFVPEGITDENRASIAFVWQGGDKKILFMGDAEPNIVKNTLGRESQWYEAIKVSHHGSKHSTSIELMCVADSMHYFLTGGNKTDKPSIETIMKIVKRENESMRTLHWNYKNNDLMKKLSTEECRPMREQYHFELSETNEYEFEY